MVGGQKPPKFVLFLEKNMDEYLDASYRENLLNECKRNGKMKLIKRVKQKLRKMENKFEKLIGNNLNLRRIQHEIEGGQMGIKLVKKMKIIWMLTNLYEFMKREKVNLKENEERKKVEKYRWIEKHFNKFE